MGNRRHNQKRTVAQALQAVEKAAGLCAELHELYKPVHPEHAQLLEAIGQGLLFCGENLKDFWRYSYGAFPENYQIYL